MSHLNERNLPMPYRNLGGTGLMVSALSFGCVCYRAALSRASQRRLPGTPRTPRTSPIPQPVGCVSATVRCACSSTPADTLRWRQTALSVVTRLPAYCSTMTLNDHTPNPPKITDGEEAYELCAAAYKGGVNTFCAEVYGGGGAKNATFCAIYI